PFLSNNIIGLPDEPASDSDEAITSFIRNGLSTGWHFASTARMGASDDDGRVVDTSFRVRELENLHVVDMSVALLMPSCHVTSFAYLTGAWAAEQLEGEYSL
ncbi:hypothetical protein GQ53DRAFT_850629, partial [Thozetella sp. PMI_491]